jgi:hypothetical protein
MKAFLFSIGFAVVMFALMVIVAICKTASNAVRDMKKLR